MFKLEGSGGWVTAFGTAAAVSGVAAAALLLYKTRNQGCSHSDVAPSASTEPENQEGWTPRQARIAQCAQKRMTGVAVVLENLEDLGNRAAILRSVEALGFYRLIL